jgi:hypothetical protein
LVGACPTEGGGTIADEGTAGVPDGGLRHPGYGIREWFGNSEDEASTQFSQRIRLGRKKW